VSPRCRLSRRGLIDCLRGSRPLELAEAVDEMHEDYQRYRVSRPTLGRDFAASRCPTYNRDQRPVITLSSFVTGS
jgi:hypothetical protein